MLLAPPGGALHNLGTSALGYGIPKLNAAESLCLWLISCDFKSQFT
jgi:hypothetical protein